MNSQFNPVLNTRFILLRDFGVFPNKLSHGMTGDVIEEFRGTYGFVCYFVKFDGDDFEYWFYGDEISVSTVQYPNKLRTDEIWMKNNNINFQ